MKNVTRNTSAFLRLSIITIAAVVLVACGDKTDKIQRWYSEAQVKQGYELYQNNCARCHQADASGRMNVKDEPPVPPLNGTAHTWHHPLPSLKRTIKKGSIPIGGIMPGFEKILSDQEIEYVIAWFQSHWSDEVYAAWDKRNKKAYSNN